MTGVGAACLMTGWSVGRLASSGQPAYARCCLTAVGKALKIRNPCIEDAGTLSERANRCGVVPEVWERDKKPPSPMSIRLDISSDATTSPPGSFYWTVQSAQRRAIAIGFGCTVRLVSNIIGNICQRPTTRSLHTDTDGSLGFGAVLLILGLLLALIVS